MLTLLGKGLHKLSCHCRLQSVSSDGCAEGARVRKHSQGGLGVARQSLQQQYQIPYASSFFMSSLVSCQGCGAEFGSLTAAGCGGWWPLCAPDPGIRAGQHDVKQPVYNIQEWRQQAMAVGSGAVA